MASTDPTSARSRFRPEIQALRAFAVAAVVINHVWPSRLQGGFLGVDVFFVISGYLITSHLIREAERTGRIRVVPFWARRARRLLPASMLVLAATLVVSFAAVPDALWKGLVRNVAASALYVVNWALAADAVDYFAADESFDPVRHFWSLSVEEQFYLVWPVVILLALVITGWRSSAKSKVLVLASVAVAASFASSVWAAVNIPSVGYFATYTRAWEFGAGAILAALAVSASRRQRGRTAVALAGWTVLLASVAGFSGSTPFPGWAASVPVVATLAIIWAGSPPSALTRAVSVRPIQFLGDISYSVYLWHWPLLVLAPFVIGSELSAITRVAIVAMTIGLGWGTKMVVEDPLRGWAWLMRWRNVPTFAAVAVVTAAAVLVAVSVTAEVDRRTDAERISLARILADPPRCLGAASSVEAGCESPQNGTVLPSPLLAKEDFGDAFDCYAAPKETRLRSCSFGDDSPSALRVALIGDSHAAMLQPALEPLALERKWHVDTFLKSACPWNATPTYFDTQWIANCGLYHDQLTAKLASSEPYDLIVTTAWRGLSVVGGDSEDERLRVLEDGYVAAWTDEAVGDTPIVVLRDNPSTPPRLEHCAERAKDLARARECVASEGESLGPDPLVSAASRVANAELVDLTSLYCKASECPMVVGGVLVRFDDSHLTATFSRTVSPYLGRAIEGVVGASR